MPSTRPPDVTTVNVASTGGRSAESGCARNQRAKAARFLCAIVEPRQLPERVSAAHPRAAEACLDDAMQMLRAFAVRVDERPGVRHDALVSGRGLAQELKDDEAPRHGRVDPGGTVGFEQLDRARIHAAAVVAIVAYPAQRKQIDARAAACEQHDADAVDA